MLLFLYQYSGRAVSNEAITFISVLQNYTLHFPGSYPISSFWFEERDQLRLLISIETDTPEHSLYIRLKSIYG